VETLHCMAWHDHVKKVCQMLHQHETCMVADVLASIWKCIQLVEAGLERQGRAQA
jgi:hypothetical protein